MNLGFGLGGSFSPGPVGTSTGGGSQRVERRGSIWEPRVELVILEAQTRRALEALTAQEGQLKRQLAHKPVYAPQKAAYAPDWNMTAEQQGRVRETLLRLGDARKAKQTELDEVLQRILELDRELARRDSVKTFQDIEKANVAAAREYQARKAAEIERRVAREARLEAARAEAARVEAARLESVQIEAARVAAVAAALEARKREEEAIAVVLWMAMCDD